MQEETPPQARAAVENGFRLESVAEWPWEYREFVRLFNEADYFEAHEVLEDLWSIEVEPLRTYYKGLIQMAVAICHWERGNPSGARKLYRSAQAYLAPYPDTYEGLPLGELRHSFDGLFAPLVAAMANDAPAPCLQRTHLPVLELPREPVAAL